MTSGNSPFKKLLSWLGGKNSTKDKIHVLLFGILWCGSWPPCKQLREFLRCLSFRCSYQARDNIDLFGSQRSLERFTETKVALGWCILKPKKDCEKLENLEKRAGLANILSLENPAERNVRHVVGWKCKQTTTLLKKFFEKMKRQQDAGSYVLIGRKYKLSLYSHIHRRRRRRHPYLLLRMCKY